jgi:putative membrane protein
MAVGAFFDADARRRAALAVERVEALTSAELVITVQRISGNYRAADLSVGFLLALLTLILLLFLPQEFGLLHFPIDVTLAFLIGAAISANLPPLRRLFAGQRRMIAEVERSARACFVERGISRTSGRSGVLVYVSLFERRAVLVPDIGVDPESLGDGWAALVARIDAAAAAADFEAFLAAVEGAGPVLAGALPRSEDDVNELPDEMHLA